MTKYWIGIVVLCLVLALCLGVIFAGCSRQATSYMLQQSMESTISNVTLYSARSATVSTLHSPAPTAMAATSPAMRPA